MRTTNYLRLSALVFGSIAVGCGSSPSSSGPLVVGGGSSGTGGVSNTGTNTGAVGGNSTTATGAGGNNTTVGGTSSGTTGGSSTGNSTGGVSSTSTGGTSSGNSTGGVSSTATGGKSSTSTGGSSATTTGGKSSTSTGGSGATTGGTSSTTTGGSGATTGGTSSTTTGGSGATTGGTSAATTGCSPASNVISDFESGKGDVYGVDVASGGKPNGFWYVYKDDTNCNGTQVPASVTDAAVAAAALATSDSRYSDCNKYAMHASIASCPTYSGFGAALSPTAGSKVNKPIDFSNYDGVTFWAKAGSGTQGPLYLEMGSQECAAPAPDGGGTAKSDAIDKYNCHGKLFTSIPTTWTQYHVPFGTTGPRWFPTVSSSSSGKSCQASNGESTDFCEVPQLVTKNMLSIQFSLEDPFNNQATAYENYDVWIDDVAGYKFSDTDNAGVAAPSTWSASGANPFPADKTYANSACKKPKGADGRLIADAFVNWKKNFVRTDGSNQKVISPEIDNGATVSEGIAYGMLIAVYMGDKALFDGLYGYWKAHGTAGSLMTWKIGGNGGQGSAIDADEDAAFALLQASKQWPSGGYSATQMIKDIWDNEIDKTSLLPTGGSNYNNSTSSKVTNPSYFAPAYYKEFAKVDTTTGHDWAGVVTAVYKAFSSGIGSAVTSGLVSAWCSNNCTAPAQNNDATDLEYQYDSHRVPWRLGVDVCWNSETSGSSYLSKLVGFFNTHSDSEGLSNLQDIYTTAGAKDTSNGANNSMSLIGCAGVGAMATGTTGFADRAWQFMLEGQYTANPTFTTGVSGGAKPGYTYYNATVGLLMMLTMTGNFYVM